MSSALFMVAPSSSHICSASGLTRSMRLIMVSLSSLFACHDSQHIHGENSPRTLTGARRPDPTLRLNASLTQYNTIARFAAAKMFHGIVDMVETEVFGHRLDLVPGSEIQHLPDGHGAPDR